MSNSKYQLTNKRTERMNFRLLYAAEASYDSNWHNSNHSHHFTELFYIIKGFGQFKVDGSEFYVKADDMIIVNPNVTHTKKGVVDQEFEYIALGIDGLQFVEEQSQDTHAYSLNNYKHDQEDISFYLKTLIKEAKNKAESFEINCQNLLEILIINVIRRTNKKLLIGSSKKVTKECRFIEQYINENYAQDITLEKLSDLTYLNKYYIVHAFKKYKGMSPINYLIDRRISEAKKLLENSEDSIAKVSEMIGFSSQSYFSQTFKKETGVTPNTYRKSKQFR